MSHISFVESFKLLTNSRIKYSFVYSWATAVSCLIATKGFPPILPFILTVISTFFITTAVYIYNDSEDSKFDKINKVKGKRPMAKGIISTKTGHLTVLASAAIGLGLAYLVNLNTMLIGVGYLVLGFLYSYPGIYLKKHLLMKETITALGPIFYGLFGMYGTTNAFSLNTFFSSIIFFIFVFTVIPLLDQSDLEEDRARGMNSLALNTSHQQRIYLAVAGMVIILLLSPLTYLYFNYNILAPILLWLMGGQLLRYIIPLAQNPETADLAKTWQTVYNFYLYSPVAFAIGVYSIPFLS